MRRAIRIFTLLSVCLLLAGAAAATTVEKLSEEQMTSKASVIAQGHCTNVGGVWEGGVLYTMATITIDDVLKGQPGSEITLVIPGGVDLDREVPVSFNVPGAPNVRPGESVLLFLEQDGTFAGGYSVVGFFQGKLSIVEGPEGKMMAVGHDGSDALDALKQRIRRSLVHSK